MQFEGAVVQEQGVTFGIVIVKSAVLNNPAQRADMVRFGQQAWGAMPIILMTEDGQGVPTYWGRQDIVQFLANVPIEAIPWSRYSI